MKIQKLKFVWNTAPDNCRVLNFMGNPYWRISSHSAKIFLINIKSLYINWVYLIWVMPLAVSTISEIGQSLFHVPTRNTVYAHYPKWPLPQSSIIPKTSTVD